MVPADVVPPSTPNLPARAAGHPCVAGPLARPQELLARGSVSGVGWRQTDETDPLRICLSFSATITQGGHSGTQPCHRPVSLSTTRFVYQFAERCIYVRTGTILDDAEATSRGTE